MIRSRPTSSGKIAQEVGSGVVVRGIGVAMALVRVGSSVAETCSLATGEASGNELHAKRERAKPRKMKMSLEFISVENPRLDGNSEIIAQ
jgi:hypothetical protein